MKRKTVYTMKSLNFCGLLLLSMVGCGKSDSDSTVSSQPGNGAAMQNNVAQGNSGAQPVVTSGAGTEPGEVVALFLDSLRRGDENAANGVLTAQAQAELAKTEYVIQPLGTPEGSYKIGRVGFVDGDTNVGLVECIWSEPNPDKTQMPIELDIVCEVHKEAQGWRISGLAVKMAGTDETLVLDFENAASLQQALEQAGGKPATPAQTASFTGQPQLGQPQLGQPQLGQPQLGQPQLGQPQLGQPQFGANAAQSNPPQFALPGQPNPGQPNPGQPNLGQLPPPPQFQPVQPPTQIALPPSGPTNRF